MGMGRGYAKKEINAELNLTAFIDMLSMCICFLLATAVWMQIGSMEVKQSHGTQGDAGGANKVEMEVQFLNAQDIKVSFRKSGRVIQSVRLKADSNVLLAEQLGTGLEGMLRKVVKVPKDFKDPLGSQVSAARFVPNRNVSYGEMISVMDVLRKNNIVNLGVVPVEG